MATSLDPIATLAHEIIYLEIKLARLQGKSEEDIKRQALLLCRLTLRVFPKTICGFLRA